MEKDSFLICKHGDMNIHSPKDTYYTINKDAYNDWFEKGTTVSYVSWGARTSYPLRSGSKVQFRWFSELNEAVKAGLKSQNKKLFEKFEESEPNKSTTKFERVDPKDWAFVLYDAQTDGIGIWWIVKRGSATYRLSLNVKKPEFGNNNLPIIGYCLHFQENRLITWDKLDQQQRNQIKLENPELYQHFEQYYLSEIEVLNRNGYTYYRFKDKEYPAARISEGYFAGWPIPKEVIDFHNDLVRAKPIESGLDFDIDKLAAVYLGRPVEIDRAKAMSQALYDAYKGPLDASDFMRLKDPYGQNWPLKQYSPNINQINNENLRTTHQCLSRRKELSGNPIQSQRVESTITTGHFGNREGISLRGKGSRIG